MTSNSGWVTSQRPDLAIHPAIVRKGRKTKGSMPGCSIHRIIGIFSSKTRTSLKTQLLFMFLEHSNFPAFSLPKSCSQTDKFPTSSLRSRISIIVEFAHIAVCFPSRRPIFAERPSKEYFSGCQFQNKTYSKSLETRKSL